MTDNTELIARCRAAKGYLATREFGIAYELADALEAVTRERDALAVQVAAVIQIAEEANNDCRIWAGKLAAAQAVIAAIRDAASEPTPEQLAEAKDWATGSPARIASLETRAINRIDRILAQSPSDDLEAHDRQVAAKALRGWADYQEGTLSTFAYVVDDCDTSETKAWCDAVRLYADRIASGEVESRG